MSFVVFKGIAFVCHYRTALKWQWVICAHEARDELVTSWYAGRGRMIEHMMQPFHAFKPMLLARQFTPNEAHREIIAWSKMNMASAERTYKCDGNELPASLSHSHAVWMCVVSPHGRELMVRYCLFYVVISLAKLSMSPPICYYCSIYVRHKKFMRDKHSCNATEI